MDYHMNKYVNQQGHGKVRSELHNHVAILSTKLAARLLKQQAEVISLALA